jgi:hypothetical protein
LHIIEASRDDTGAPGEITEPCHLIALFYASGHPAIVGAMLVVINRRAR